MDTLSDEILVGRCKKRDTGAFRLLVERYKKQSYAFAYSYVRNTDDALSVSQEAFVKAWNAMGSFIEGKQFRPWLFSIVKNLSLNHIDSRKRKKEVSLDAAMEAGSFQAVYEGDDPQVILEKKELHDTVWDAVESLKEEFCEVIVLKHVQDLSYNEIAETLNIPLGTVMSRLYYARLELKKKLETTLQRS